jgi:hypothetical protein
MSEIREWLQLGLLVVGGVIGVSAFFQNLQQRRVENALKFIDLFKAGLRDGDIAKWDKLFRNSSEPAGMKAGRYIKDDGSTGSIGEFFAEGAPDGYAVSRMAESLEVVAYQAVTGAADARTIFFELGQLLRFLHYHLAAVPSSEAGKNLLEVGFPNIQKFFKKYGKNADQWPSRVHSYVE